MSNLKSELKQLADKIVYEKGWKAFKDSEIETEPEMDPIMGAYIDLGIRRITIMAGEKLPEAVDKTIKEEKLPIGREEFLDALGYFVVLHEHAHHRICPGTKSNFEEMLNRSYEALQGREIRAESLKGLCFYIANMFEDTIINSINSLEDTDKAKYRQGLSLFYLLVNGHQRPKGLLGRLTARADKAHTLFLNTNQLLCQSSKQFEKNMRKYHALFFAGFERYRDKMLDIFTGDRKLSDEVLKRNEKAIMDAGLAKRLADSNLWGDMIYDYTNLVYPFLKEQHEWMKRHAPKQNQESNSAPGQGVPSEEGKPKEDYTAQKGGSGDDKKDKEQKDKKEKGGSGDDKKDKEDSSDGKQRDEKDYRSDPSLYRFFKRLFERIKDSQIADSPYVNQLARLDHLYRQRAGSIEIIADMPGESKQFEKRIGLDEISPGEFSSHGIEWSSTRMYDTTWGETKIHLYKKASSLTLPFAVEESIRGVPDISFIFDSSSSEDFKPFKGEGEGEYHLAALTFYSILNYLEKTGLAPLINYNMINFSTFTRTSGWQPYLNLREVVKTLFNYQGGGTVLDPKAIRDLRTGRKDNFLCFMLSDTGFNFPENEKEVADEIYELVDSGAVGFCLFQLGLPTTCSRALQDRGIMVHPTKGVEDFMDVSVKFTKNLYGEVLKNA